LSPVLLLWVQYGWSSDRPLNPPVVLSSNNSAKCCWLNIRNYNELLPLQVWHTKHTNKTNINC
jgi:hypothetical protein